MEVAILDFIETSASHGHVRESRQEFEKRAALDFHMPLNCAEGLLLQHARTNRAKILLQKSLEDSLL